MSDENNKRYIGEVFIDGKSDRLLQEFLTQLFNSYNGPGKGFNADMVDDWHLVDIIQYVDEGLETKLDSITIGNTIFTVYDSSKFLQLTDVVYNEFKDPENSPWAQLLIDDAKKEISVFNRGESSFYADGEDYLASDIFLDIYAVLDGIKVDVETFAILDEFCQELGRKHDKLREEFDDFVEPFKDIFKEVEITDLEGNTKIIKMIDAQLINGFRIIPITQAAYDALPTKEKTYWRNIYIIVDEVPDDYVNPISFELFKDVKLVYNPDTQYLDYYDGISSKPRPLISMVDLVNSIDFTTQFRNFLENTSDFEINPTSLKNSIKSIVLNASDFAELPFLSKIEARPLPSAITSDFGTITKTSNTNDIFSTFNISNAFNTKFNAITTEFSKVRKEMTDANNDLKEYMGSNYHNKGYINNKLSSIESSISTFNTKINNKVTGRTAHYFIKFHDGKELRTSDNSWGISLTIQDNIGIIVFNNPVFKWKNSSLISIPVTKEGDWWTITRPSENPSIQEKLIGIGTGEEWKQNYYSNTSSHFGPVGRMRVTTSGKLQVYVQKDWLKEEEHGFGWGQIVIPWGADKATTSYYLERYTTQ